MKCPSCGAEIPEDSEFCCKCGSKVKNESAQNVINTNLDSTKKHKLSIIRDKIKNNTIASALALILSFIIAFVGLNFLAKTTSDAYVTKSIMNCQETIVALEKSAPLLAGSLESDTQKLSNEGFEFAGKIALIVFLVLLSFVVILIAVRMIIFFLNKNRNKEIEKDKFTALIVCTLIIFAIGTYITYNNTKSAIQLISSEAAIANESSNDSSSADNTISSSPEVTTKPELIVDSNGKKIWKVYYTEKYIHFTMTYKGTGNFIIDVLDSNQNLYENVVNEIGDYVLDKTVPAPVDDGSGYYYIQQQVSDGVIEDGGQWSCTNN